MLRQLFKHFGRPDVSGLHAAVASEAREVAYYHPPFLVPDTLDGRFELLVLIAHLALRRLSNRVDGGDKGQEAKEQREARAISQALFDRIFSDLDRDLREMGMGDHSVPKQIQRMADSFFGRGQAYEAALQTGELAALASSVRKNLLGTIDLEVDLTAASTALARRAQEIAETLDARGDASVLAGNWDLPPLQAPAKGADQ